MIRLDPTGVGKPGSKQCKNVIDIGSNNPNSTDLRDLAGAKNNEVDARAPDGIGHNGLLSNPVVRDAIKAILKGKL